MPSINFSNIPTMDPVAKGVYAAQFDSFENDFASTDGSEMITMTFIITEEGEFKGRKLLRNHSMKEQALWAFKRTCIALGADASKFEADEELDTDELLADLQGAACRLAVREKIYEGEKRSEIRAILAPQYDGEFAAS